jgi:hypothetical protein
MSLEGWAQPPAGWAPLGRTEAAGRLGVRPGTVDKWVERGIFPAPSGTIGGRPFWFEGLLDEWARTRTDPRRRRPAEFGSDVLRLEVPVE